MIYQYLKNFSAVESSIKTKKSGMFLINYLKNNFRLLKIERLIRNDFLHVYFNKFLIRIKR